MKRSTFAKAGMAAMALSFVMVMVLAACAGRIAAYAVIR
jgi:hypothetical protein